MSDDTTPDIDTFLKNLGKTTDEIAANLRANNCKGDHGRPTSCPVSQAITKRFSRPAYVTGVSCWFRDDTPGFWYLPNVVSDFIVKFDMGMYPELEAGK